MYPSGWPSSWRLPTTIRSTKTVSANSKPGEEQEPYFQVPTSLHSNVVFNKKITRRGATSSEWWGRRFLLSSPKENRFERLPTDQTASAEGPERSGGCQRGAGQKKPDTGCTEEAKNLTLPMLTPAPNPHGGISGLKVTRKG